MNAEEVKVGGYQILTLLLLSINFIIVAMSHALTIFYKYTPKFYCQESIGQDGEDSPSSVGVTKNLSYSCSGALCQGQYVFDASRDYEHSVATEWQLICERDYLLRLGGHVYFAGLLLGGLVAGIITDRIGRLPVLAICLYAQGTMAVALNVVQEYQLFLVFRGMQGFFIQGLESCTFILCIELFPAKFRTVVALIILSMRSVGLVILSGLSYAIPDWRILQLVVAVPTAVTVLYIWIIPESPRWLLAMGKLTEAEMLLEKIENYNSRCGLSKKGAADDSEKVQTSKDQAKPQKPKRKTRASDADANSLDVEKSLEESKNLLLSTVESEAPRVQTSASEKNLESTNDVNSEKKSDLPSESNIEETAMASLTIVTDEKNPSPNNKSENDDQSYHLVAKEALAAEDTNNKKNNVKPRSGFSRWLESKYIGRTCLILMSIWFSSSMAFHALVSLPNRLSHERHVSMSLAAAMELVTFVFVFLIISSRCGRRWPLCLAQLLVAIACLTIAVFTAILPQSHWIAYVKTTIVTIGRIINIGCFFILRILVIELFPTISRGTGVALCVGAEMIGGLLTPFVLMLNRYVLELPRFLIGFFCICTGLLTLIFPETLHNVLPDTIEEAKNLGKTGHINGNKNHEIIREKLFSEEWVDAGNGIIVNFTDNKDSE